MKNRNLVNNLKALGFIATVDALGAGAVAGLCTLGGLPWWIGLIVFGVSVPTTMFLARHIDKHVRSVTDSPFVRYPIQESAKGFDAIYKKFPTKIFRAITGRKAK